MKQWRCSHFRARFRSYLWVISILQAGVRGPLPSKPEHLIPGTVCCVNLREKAGMWCNHGTWYSTSNPEVLLDYCCFHFTATWCVVFTTITLLRNTAYNKVYGGASSRLLSSGVPDCFDVRRDCWLELSQQTWKPGQGCKGFIKLLDLRHQQAALFL